MGWLVLDLIGGIPHWKVEKVEWTSFISQMKMMFRFVRHIFINTHNYCTYWRMGSAIRTWRSREFLERYRIQWAQVGMQRCEALSRATCEQSHTNIIQGGINSKATTTWIGAIPIFYGNYGSSLSTLSIARTASIIVHPRRWARHFPYLETALRNIIHVDPTFNDIRGD